MERTTIWVTFQQEGIHNYPAAANLSGVEFLAHPHRHMFHFKVEIEVFHDDRDIEFILLKRELQSLFSEDGPVQADNKSCEMLAKDIYQYLQSQPQYQNRYTKIEVSEDGENGATYEVIPTR